MHFPRIDFEKVASIADRDFLARKMSSTVNRRICLRDKEIFLAIAREVINLVRHATLLDLPIRRLDETKFIDARKRAHRANQANVGTFRRLDRTNSAVMRRMNIAHFESGTIT